MAEWSSFDPRRRARRSSIPAPDNQAPITALHNAPPPLAANETSALQFALLTTEYVTRAAKLLDPTVVNPASPGSLARAFTRVASTSAFKIYAPTFGPASAYAEITRGLHALQTAAAKLAQTLPSPADAPNPNPQSGNNRANTPNSFLQAAQTPPRSISHFPPLRPNSENPASLPANTRVTRQLQQRVDRTARALTGYEDHELMRVTLSSPISTTRALRTGLVTGGMSGPCSVIPTANPRIVYLLGEPQHLKTADPAYRIFKDTASARNNRLPEAAFALVNNVLEEFRTVAQMREILQKTREELERLANPLIKWAPKKYFLESLTEFAQILYDKLAECDNDAPELELPRPTSDSINRSVASSRKRRLDAIAGDDTNGTANVAKSCGDRPDSPQPDPEVTTTTAANNPTTNANTEQNAVTSDPNDGRMHTKNGVDAEATDQNLS